MKADINPTTDYVNLIEYVLQEEVAQENQQKIEAEKKAVHEAKTELDKHQKTAEDIESKYSSVRERIDQLSEDSEPLKVQQSFVVSLCLETKNTFRNQDFCCCILVTFVT